MTAEEHFDAANLCEFHEEFAKAIEHYTEAIKLQPHFPDAYFNRAGDRELEGDIGNAIRDYEMAIQQDPTEPISYLYLANLFLNDEYEKFSCPKKALPLAKQACRLTEDQSYEALSTLAKAYAGLGRFGEAIKYQKRAIGILRGTVKVAQAYEPPVDREVWLWDMEAALETYQDSHRPKWWERILGLLGH